jgi:hypothetical protein
MPMDDQDLRRFLEQLHQEIGRTQDVDDRGKELLRELEADVRELLAHSEDAIAPPHPSKLRHLEDTIHYLEVSHPALTAMMVEVLQTLSNAGI